MAGTGGDISMPVQAFRSLYARYYIRETSRSRRNISRRRAPWLDFGIIMLIKVYLESASEVQPPQVFISIFSKLRMLNRADSKAPAVAAILNVHRPPKPPVHHQRSNDSRSQA